MYANNNKREQSNDRVTKYGWLPATWSQNDELEGRVSNKSDDHDPTNNGSRGNGFSWVSIMLVLLNGL